MPSQLLDVNSDANERDNNSFFNDSNSTVRMDDSASSSTRFNGGFEYVLTSDIPPGATVDTAHGIYEMDGTEQPEVTIHGNATADANDFTTEADVTDRTRTTAGAAWSDSGLTGSQNSPELKSIIQELVDDNGGLSSGASVCLLFIANGVGTSTFRVDSAEGTTPSQLYIEWTEAGGGGGNPHYAYAQQ